MRVLGKNGELDYDKEKVEKAITNAFIASDNEHDTVMVDNLVTEVTQKLKALNKNLVTKDEVLNTIQHTLMANRFFTVAETFIQYRYQHMLQKDIMTSAVGGKRLFSRYLDKTDWKVSENSNMNFSLQGLNNFIITEMTAQFWLDAIYQEDISDAHIKGYFHLHDLGLLAPYCVGWDLYELLVRGFRGVEGKVESGPPKHFSTALGQVVNFLYTLQGEAAGAQALSNFDTLLAPFIREDAMTFKQVKQELQSFMFNMNVPTRVGGQSPFTNITLDLIIPKHFKEQPVIIGGTMQKDAYGDYQKEVDTFNKALFEVMYAGDGKERIFTFPIPTVNITKDFDWDNKNLDGLWELESKYGSCYFSNFVSSDMDPEDTRSLCCRLRLDKRELLKRGGGLFGANALTGSIGVVTLNMPMIAYEANGSVDKFNTILVRFMDKAKRALEAKRKVLEEYTDKGLYPYSRYYLDNVKLKEGKYWANHFSTIGLVGLYEAAANLGIDYTADEGKKFAVQTLSFMRRKLLEYQKDTGNLYNLEATPAEGTSYRLALLSKKIYPKIITSGSDKVPIFTNSSQLPVNYTKDIFKVLEHQDILQGLYTGGTVLHMYLGETMRAEDIKVLVKKVFSKYTLPYLSITPTFSVCPTHGYIVGKHELCPKCAEEKEILIQKVKNIKEKIEKEKAK